MILKIFGLLLFISAACFAEVKVLEETHDVKSGAEVKLRPPRYPSPGRIGERQIWHLKAAEGSKVRLLCDVLTIGPSVGCENSFLDINDGEKSAKYCGNVPALTVVSKGNTMTVVFELIRFSGFIDCGATAILPEAPEEPDKSPEGNIELKLGEAYDQINFQSLALTPGLNKKWTFTTSNDAHIGATCRVYFEETCENQGLTVDGKHLCQTFNYTTISSGNSLTIEAKAANGKGIIDCLVQSVTGPYVDHYRNVGSQEIDSSEHGVRAGAKSTSCKCGWSKKQASRIVNGQEVQPGEYPWVVALKSAEGQFCGGSIISEYHILTAAHCTMGRRMSEITVTVGSTNRVEGGEDFHVFLIREHMYRKRENHLNDIAIITLDRKIPFSETVGPICLSPYKPKLDNKYITVSGWGYLDSIKYVHPEILRKTHMKVVNHKTCSWHWFRSFQSDPDRVCTWATNKDSCMGDSGGPVVYVDPETNRYTQVGLVSFGRGCNTDFPKVNTFVPHYYQWIQKEVLQKGSNTCRKLG